MSAKDYMKVNKNGLAAVNFDSYTGNKFVIATKVKDIAKIRILKREELANLGQGHPDVMLYHATGEVNYISRAELVKNYRYLSGKPIKMQYLKCNKPYSVEGRCQQEYAVIPLTKFMTGFVKGKQVKQPFVIVAPLTQDGQFDCSNVNAINLKTFRKMFVIHPQDVITRNKGRMVADNLLKRGQKKVRSFEHGDSGITNDINPLGNGSGVAFNNKRPVVNLNQKQPMQGNMNNKPIQESRYKYRVIGRVVDEHRHLLGYLVEDLNGTRRTLVEAKLIELCDKHSVANVISVTNDRGAKYLRGNGIRLEALPEYLP